MNALVKIGKHLFVAIDHLNRLIRLVAELNKQSADIINLIKERGNSDYEEEILNIQQAALLAGVSRRTVYSWKESNKIKPIKGSEHLFLKSEIMKQKK